MLALDNTQPHALNEVNLQPTNPPSPGCSSPSIPRKEQQRLLVQLVGADYWDRLMKAGIPRKQARRIAAAIAKYDIAQRPPKPYQKKLIRHYCSQVCRARLWRSCLLLNDSSNGPVMSR